MADDIVQVTSDTDAIAGAAVSGVGGGCFLAVLGFGLGLLFLTFLKAIGLGIVAFLLGGMLVFAVLAARPYYRIRSRRRRRP